MQRLCDALDRLETLLTSTICHQHFYRRVLSCALNGLLQVLLKFSGTDTHGPKLLNRLSLQSIIAACELDRGQYDTELVLRAVRAQKRIIEAPSEYRELRPNRNWMVKKILWNLWALARLVRIMKHVAASGPGALLSGPPRGRSGRNGTAGATRAAIRKCAVFNAPQPRSRLYTTARSTYAGLMAGAAFGGTDDEGEVAKLESALAARLSVAHVIAVPQARVGIYLTIKHLVRPGQKVVLSPYTIADVVNMVVCAGAVPVFADVAGDGSCNIDPAAVAELLDRESNVGAVMVTHFYGLACDIEPIRQACARARVPLIEDAAQAFGARLPAGLAGTVGRAGIFSFGLLKNVTGFLGGAVVTGNDADLAAADIRAELATFPMTHAQAFVEEGRQGRRLRPRYISARVLFGGVLVIPLRLSPRHGLFFEQARHRRQSRGPQDFATALRLSHVERAGEHHPRATRPF